jgi:tetratricopeptide (TPR) repeat protein
MSNDLRRLTTMKKIINLIFVFLLMASCSVLGDIKMEEAFNALDAGDFELAIVRLLEAVELKPSSYSEEQIYTMIGNAYNDQADFSRALEYHNKVLELNPDSPTGLLNRGINLRLLGKYGLAEESYRKALWLEPNMPEVHTSLGALYIVQEKPLDAVDSLNKAILLDSSLPVAHSNLSIALAMLGRFDEAEASLAKAESYGYPHGKNVRQDIAALRLKLEETLPAANSGQDGENAALSD